MNRMISFLFKRAPEPTSDFSAFFVDAKAREKKRVIQDAVKKANEDQRDLMRRAEQLAAQR
jgi:hypothetical protein